MLEEEIFRLWMDLIEERKDLIGGIVLCQQNDDWFIGKIAKFTFDENGLCMHFRGNQAARVHVLDKDSSREVYDIKPTGKVFQTEPIALPITEYPPETIIGGLVKTETHFGKIILHPAKKKH